jgi:hypothetical protein
MVLFAILLFKFSLSYVILFFTLTLTLIFLLIPIPFHSLSPLLSHCPSIFQCIFFTPSHTHTPYTFLFISLISLSFLPLLPFSLFNPPPSHFHLSYLNILQSLSESCPSGNKFPLKLFVPEFRLKSTGHYFDQWPVCIEQATEQHKKKYLKKSFLGLSKFWSKQVLF